MHFRSTAATVVLFLSACGAESGDGSLQPGRWEIRDEPVASASAPGWEAKEMSGSTRHICITPEQAAHPNADLLLGFEEGRCRSTFSMAGGRIEGSSDCAGDTGSTVVTFEGEYSPRHFAIRDWYETDLATGLDISATATRPVSMKVTIEVHTSGRYVGECTGDEEERA